MKKQVKIISAVLIILAILIAMTNIVSATTTSGALNTLGEDKANEDVLNFGQKIVPIVRAIGIIAAVVILMIVGIKYMMGSAEEKAEYKKTMPAYVIGAVLVFGATQILAFIVDIATKSFN